MFIAHTSDTCVNKFNIVKQLNKQWIIINDGNLSKLVSNICPHQKSLISTDNVSTRVCPYHGWSFDLNGNPIGSGLTECKNNSKLESKSLSEWKNLLFTKEVKCDELKEIDLSSMTLVESRIDIVAASPITIMDIFLDVKHIPLVHKGVYEQINLNNIRDVEWHLQTNTALQKVYDSNGILGAAWLAVYPGTMIEWQKGSLFITVIIPSNDKETKVVVYKYRDEKSNDSEWQLNENIWEKSWQQDKHQAELIQSIDTDNLEPEKLHFRKWIVNGTN